MPNHFHILIQIKEDTVLKPPHQYFSNLFNAYTQAYNKAFKRRGTLFQRPFKRKLVKDEDYFKSLLVYIHKNPVHHGFVNHPIEWGWSSYLACLSEKETKLHRDLVLEWFGGRDNMKFVHEQTIYRFLLEEIDDV